MFYFVEKTTCKRASLQTTNEKDDQQLIDAKNQAERQPVLNLQIAQAYVKQCSVTCDTTARQRSKTVFGKLLIGFLVARMDRHAYQVRHD
jgi:hypothetical protein